MKESISDPPTEQAAAGSEPAASAPATDIEINFEDAVAALKRRLATLPLFKDIEPASFETLGAELSWFTLRGGLMLFREGEPGDVAYFVLSGRLGVITATADGGERILAQIGPDETVGEMALLSNEPRSASVVALCDSELLGMPKVAFERMLMPANHAQAFLIDVLTRRLRETSHQVASEAPPKAIAVLPISPGLDAGKFVTTMARALARLGSEAHVVRAQTVPRPDEWYAAVERTSGMVVYEAANDGSQWARLCMRQADRVLLLADGGSLADVPVDRIRQLLRGRRPATVE
ncbi:MAG: Crp/Fnr family transcriptional regulator, partial [Candidatus Binataceae bacterium]